MSAQRAPAPQHSNGSGTPKRVQKSASSQNLNHLLNFTLPPRQAQLYSIPRRSRRTVTGSGFWNKERFVNAQYRFMMNPTGDYTVHFADPDIFFQWQDILQVIIPRTSAFASATANGESAEGQTTCPICLSPPAAPRMTKCGHIFCFPCILHYLSTSDNLKWIRCPICFDSVNERQLKPVKWFNGSNSAATEDEGLESNPKGEGSSTSSVGLDIATTPKVGDTLRMRLMQRPQITTLALPRSSTWPSDVLPPHQAPFHFLPDVYDYAKFMLATPEYLIADLTHDIDELDTERHMLFGMNDSLGVGFVDAAAERIKRQIAYAEALELDQGVKIAMAKAHRDLQEALKRDVKARQRRRDAVDAPPTEDGAPNSYVASPSPLPVTSQQAPSGRNARQRKNLNPLPPSSSSFYYYQAGSGLPIFLHPLDIKILLAHFSAYASFPDTVTIRIEAFSEGSVDDDLRKRCKYLGHLPEGTDVVFIEADLEGVVGLDGMKAFEGALKSRRSRRREKEKRDERASKRAEERIREKETAIVRNNSGWSGSWTAAAAASSDAVIGAEPYPFERAQTPVEELAPSSTPPQPLQVSGAWGSRSFASTARSAPTNGGGGRAAQRPTLNVDDDWDVDEAWHELEQRAATGGGPGSRKKRTARMVVLGGGAGGRRR